MKNLKLLVILGIIILGQISLISAMVLEFRSYENNEENDQADYERDLRQIEKRFILKLYEDYIKHNNNANVPIDVVNIILEYIDNQSDKKEICKTIYKNTLEFLHIIENLSVSDYENLLLSSNGLIDINFQSIDFSGQTPLIIAIGQLPYNCDKELNCIEFLIKNGADVKLADFDGKTPMMHANKQFISKDNKSKLLKLLKDGEIKSNTYFEKIIENFRSDFKETQVLLKPNLKLKDESAQEELKKICEDNERIDQERQRTRDFYQSELNKLKEQEELRVRRTEEALAQIATQSEEDIWLKESDSGVEDWK